MSSLTVRLTSPAGRSRIVLPSSSTLAELQAEVKTRCGVEPGDQQLSFDPAGNRPIDGPPSAQLSQLGFVNGSEVHLRNREASIAGQVLTKAPASSGSAPKAVESDGKKADPKFETFDAFLRKRQYDVGALPGNQKYVTVKITRGGMLKIPPSVSIKQQPGLDSLWIPSFAMGLGWLHPAADSSARGDKVLVVGDGDLSFSAALSTSELDLRLTATTLESREDLSGCRGLHRDLWLCCQDLLRRYARSREHIGALEEAGAIVLHAVDATCLQQHLQGKTELSFDRIIFNFPYQATGGIKGLRRLLGAFLADAAGLLAADGVIEVALCAGQGGTAADGPRLRGWAGSWRVPLLAAHAGLALAGLAPLGERASGCKDYEFSGIFRWQGLRDCLQLKQFWKWHEGALLHRFVWRPRASLAPAQVLSDLAKDRIAASKQVLKSELHARDVEASWQEGPRAECAPSQKPIQSRVVAARARNLT
eukprot:s359_g6.t1